MTELISGAVAMGFAVASLFFYRFWRKTGDRLFALFSLSFVILAVNRVAMVLTTQQGYKGDYLYWVRLLAFGCILVAILDKNRVPKANGAIASGEP